MSSDVEMDDSSQSGTEIEPVFAIAPDVLAARKPGPAHFVHKGKHYDWRPHEDNCRAYTKPSIIWQLGDEYEKRGNSHRKQYWRCGICKNHTVLAIEGGSSSGLRHLKKQHKIDKKGLRIGCSQRNIISAFAAAATTVATLVARFNADTFRYLFIHWIVTMHIALNWWERGLIQQLQHADSDI